MNIKRILVIGGDSRIEYLASALAADGYEVKIFSSGDTLKGALDGCDAVILGLPASLDDKTVDAPGLENPVLIKDLFHMMGNRKLLLAGKMSDALKAVADVFSVKWADYFARPETEILNAVPTCEGAVQIAMEELPVTLHGSKVIITGYGRIGKLLAKDLSALGTEVCVCARKISARAQCCADGFYAMDFPELPEKIRNADIVFNTVPQCVIGKEVLSNAKNTLVIDLASKPGGVEFYLDKVLLYPFVKHTLTHTEHFHRLACCYLPCLPHIP